MKIAMPVDATDPADLAYFADACRWALARAHAHTGDPAMIAGYLGTSDAFDDAMMKFAESYADQTERDYEALLKAISGRIKVRSGGLLGVVDSGARCGLRCRFSDGP